MRAALMAVLVILMISCNAYQESSISETTINELNQTIDSARVKQAAWSRSPENIARALFPQVSSEGNRTYNITSEDIGDEAKRVTVLEEGAIDDETSGIRRILEFKRERGRWKLLDYQYASKR